jgi:hypothetical protein
MVSVIVFSILLIIALVQSWIFSLPIRIPFIKRLAINHRTLRWTAIILLSIVPTTLNAVGWTWLATASDIADIAEDASACNPGSGVYCNPEQDGFVRAFNLDYALKDELVYEVTLRNLFAGDTCVSDTAAVCAAADYWIVLEEADVEVADEANGHFTMLDGLWVWLFLTVLLSPTFMTAFDIYHLTHRSPRKSKYVV